MKSFTLLFLFIGSMSHASFFEKGNSSVGVVLGAGSSNNESYTVAGISADYFVARGLSIGAGYRGWFGNTPTINQLTVSTNYFLPVTKQFHPYIGGFVRETFVSGSEDYESYGARGGLAINMSNNSYMSFGYVYEKYGNCTETVFTECSSSYPELVFSLAF